LGHKLVILGREIDTDDYAPAVAVRVSEVPQPWLDNVMQGTTANDADLQRAANELAEANRIAAMDMDQYAAERRRLGLSRDLGQFLSGH
jgi:hypothetical protein